MLFIAYLLQFFHFFLLIMKIRETKLEVLIKSKIVGDSATYYFIAKMTLINLIITNKKFKIVNSLHSHAHV